MNNFYATQKTYMRGRLISEKAALIDRGNKYLSVEDVLIKLIISILSGGIILIICLLMDLPTRDDFVGIAIWWLGSSVAVMAIFLFWGMIQKRAIETKISRINRRVLWQ